MKLVAIWDAAIQAFGRPVAVVARGEAIRSFMDEINNAESHLSKHPADYDLHLVGEFDEHTGKSSEVNELLIRGVDAKKASA